MPRKSSSGKRRHSSRGGGSYRKHIYFEARGGGADSVFKAVPDIGRKGVNTGKELMMIAGAQLADLADLKTKDHHGKTRKWTHRLWGGRSYVIWRLFYALKGKGKVKQSDAKKLRMILNSGHRIMEIKPRQERVKRIKQVLRKAGFSDREINELLKSTN